MNGQKFLAHLKNTDNAITKGMMTQEIELLYNAGRSIGIKNQSLVKRGSGTLTWSAKTQRSAITGKQKAAVRFLQDLAKITGFDIEVFESEKNEAGEFVGEQGSYVDGRIRIDLNAGLNTVTDSIENTAMLRTASHEITHWFKDASPDAYFTLRNFMIDHLAEYKGRTLDQLVMDKIARSKSKNLSYDAALDEVVADGCEMILRDSNMVRKLGETNRGLFNKVKDWLKNWLRNLKKAFEGTEAVHHESRYLMENFAEEMVALWDEALKTSVENTGGKVQKKMTVKARAAQKALNDTNVVVDTATASVAPSIVMSERTWTESDYVRQRQRAAEEIAEAIGVSVEKAKAYIDDINSVAKAIADDRTRLDYFSSPNRSSFVSNAEYGGSFDFSTLCKKRRLLTGTFTAIQRALPNTALTASEILEIRNRMKKAGLEVSCGLCYVEGSRANMGQFAKEFLRLYQQYYPNSWQPNMADVNTPDGIEWVRINHPEVYEQYEYFWNHYGTLKPGDKKLFASQQKPKLYQLHTEYKNEILDKFKGDKVDGKNKAGGVRLQSFSDFEIVHLIDCMQIIMDMSRVGLAGQAYTKVPDFAWALGDTGLKINLSLIAKGVDENGKLIFDDVEGMPIAEAMKLRDRYSKNVGTILVAFNDAQLMAAMADDRVDFIIPFHRSQWKKSQYSAMGLPTNTKDYTFMQNEKYIKPQYHEYRGKMVRDKATNYMPNDFWDFSKTGKENAEAYLEMCAANNKRPKFYKLLQNNGDGSYSLKPDGSTDGYWKLLIDFKMYDNDGVGSPPASCQTGVQHGRGQSNAPGIQGRTQPVPGGAGHCGSVCG